MKIVQEIREEIHAALREPSRRDLNILALLFLVIPGVIGSYLAFLKAAPSGYVWMAVGACLAVCRLIPPLFRLIYRLWVGLSVIIGYFISRVLLTLIFFLVLLPTGLIMRVVGRDPMDRKFDPAASSYWNRKEDQAEASVERYEKQF